MPKDNFEINNSELFAAQVIDENGKPLVGVNVLAFQKAALKQDSNKAFSKTLRFEDEHLGCICCSQ